MAVALGGLLLVAWWLGGIWYARQLATNKHADVAVQLSSRSAALQTDIGGRFALLDGMVGLVQSQPSAAAMDAAFPAFAASLMASKSSAGIRNFALFPDGEQRYELIMGERRWRATQAAGLERVPAIVRDTSDDDLLRDALLENLHRSDLNPLEEAAAYQQLLDDFGCTHEELATRIGRSRPQISNTIRLLASVLPFGYKLLVREHRLNLGRRRTQAYGELAQLPNVVLIDPFDSQFKYLKHASLVVTENGSSGWEGLLLQRRVLLLSDATFYQGCGQGVTVSDPDRLNRNN